DAPRMDERFHRTLTRNVAIAAVVAASIALLRHEPKAFLPIAVLALWPSLGGHYVELLFVNGLRDQIPPGRLTQALVRLLVWFVGGVLLYLCMVMTARALPLKPFPPGLWWCGGFLFIAIELAVHAILAVRGQANFYDGRG